MMQIHLMLMVDLSVFWTSHKALKISRNIWQMFWEWLSPPVIKIDKTGSRYAVILENKRQTQLYVGKSSISLGWKWYSRGHRTGEIKTKVWRWNWSGAAMYWQLILWDIQVGRCNYWAIGSDLDKKWIQGETLYPCLLRLYTMLAKLNRKQFL